MSRFPIGRLILILAVLVSFSGEAATVPVFQGIPAELSRAQSLYFSAEFEASVALLRDLEKRIGNGAQRSNDLLQVKLFLGLALLGVNQAEEAKAKFVEVTSLNPEYTIDPGTFSPKVVDLFNEAKAISVEARCTQFCGRIDTLIADGNFSTAYDQIKLAGAGCSCANAKVGAVTEATFERGKQLYNDGRFDDAAKEFSAVLAMDEKHELARDYSQLIQERLQLTIRQGYADWRMSFDQRQFDKASAAYEKLRANVHPEVTPLVIQIESEYNRVLSGFLSSWRAACTGGDHARSETIRNEAETVASGLPFAQNTLAQMQQCTSRVCIKGDPALALTRLKTRVNPELDPSLQRYVTRRIIVRIEIDEKGSVRVNEVVNANDRVASAVKDAVERWKFTPVVIDDHTRCVETELPVSLIF
jgi:tetratricopeptide (TPR) repeat protein